MQPDVLAFNVQWYDTQAELVRFYRLNCYSDKTLDIINEATKATFLKRIHYPNVSFDDLYLGATINVYKRNLQITAYYDEGTAKFMSKVRGRAFALITPRGNAAYGPIVGALMERFTVPAMKTVVISEMEASSLGLPPGLTLAVEVIFKGGDAAAIEEMSGLCNTLTSIEACYVSGPETLSADAEHFFAKANSAAATGDLEGTLALVKPHVIASGRCGKMLTAIAELGFDLAALELSFLDIHLVTQLLEVYKGVLPEFTETLDHLTTGPVVALQIKHHSGDHVAEFNEACGPADVEIAKLLRPQSLRAQYGSSGVLNGLHCTDLPEDGNLEVSYMFSILSQKLAPAEA